MISSCINFVSLVLSHCTANVLCICFIYHTEHARHGPVFTLEPSDSVFPMSTGDKLVFINCKAKGNPSPYYRYCTFLVLWFDCI